MNINRKLFIFLSALGISFFLITAQAAKKYKFFLQDAYQIEHVQGSSEDNTIMKVWATASNAKKAVEKAKQDAVAAVIFGGSFVDPIVTHREIFDNERDYFEAFFTSGEYLNYVHEVNSAFPTGENNIQTPEGRRVGIMLIVDKTALRKKLEEDGLVLKMSNILRN